MSKVTKNMFLKPDVSEIAKMTTAELWAAHEFVCLNFSDETHSTPDLRNLNLRLSFRKELNARMNKLLIDKNERGAF